MQARKYPQPSARSRAYIRRNILSPVEEQEDASWLNDVSPASPVTPDIAQKHIVSYEDLPTMPLSFLKSSGAPQITQYEESLTDQDATVRLSKHKKEQTINITISLPGEHKAINLVQVQFADGSFYTIKAAL